MVPEVDLNGLNVSYEVVRRNIKFPRLELKTGSLMVIVPKNYLNPEYLVQKHKNWIYDKITLIEQSKINSKSKTTSEITEEELRALVTFLVEEYSKDLDAHVNSVRFRVMVSKWGSCSTKKTLTFNKCLRYLPEDVIRYVVFHEMIHLIEKRHNTHFWSIIATKFKDYGEKEGELLDYWFIIQSKNNMCNLG